MAKIIRHRCQKGHVIKNEALNKWVHVGVHRGSDCKVEKVKVETVAEDV